VSDALEKLQHELEVARHALAEAEARLVLAEGLRDYPLTGSRVETRLGTSLVGFGLDITERKREQADLIEQLEELRRWYDVTLGRKERILELKHEVNGLPGQAGQRRATGVQNLQSRRE